MKNKFFVALLVIAFLAVNVSAVTESVSLNDYVVDFEYEEGDVESGQTFRLTATVTNEAGETRSNIEISLDVDDPFDVTGDEVKNLGTLEDGESKSVSFRIEVDEDTSSDEYALDFDVKDNEDEDGDEVLIDVESNVAELIIGNVESEPTVLSPDLEDVKLTLTLENTEDKEAEFVRARLILPQGFTPSGSYSDTANLGTIAGSSSKEVEFFIDTAEQISSGAHVGRLELEYEEDGEAQTDTLEFDLPVKGRPQFQVVRTSTSPSDVSEGVEGTLSIEIENTGEEEGKETSIRVFENSDQPFEFEEKTNFIGDLSPGESGTGTLKFLVDSDAVAKVYLVRVQVRTVENGNVLIEETSVPVRVEASEGGGAVYWIIGAAVVLVIILIILVWRMTRTRGE